MQVQALTGIFAVKDLDKARQFYAGTLGLAVEDVPEMRLLQLNMPGGGRILVYAKPDHEPANFTVLNIVVDDVRQAAEELAGKGITFERYDGMEQDDAGISRGLGPNIAWFKDPSGNIVAVFNEKP